MKKISNWLLGAWLSFCSLLQIYPDALMQVWIIMPDDLKYVLPPFVVKSASYSILVMSMLAKMHSMKKQNDRLKNDSDSV